MDKEINRKSDTADAAGYACTAKRGIPSDVEMPKYPTDFGIALRRLWNGEKVFRWKWNGKGMYLALQIPDAHSKMSRPYIYIRTADNQLVPWVASQSDLLAEDWEIFK